MYQLCRFDFLPDRLAGPKRQLNAVDPQIFWKQPLYRFAKVLPEATVAKYLASVQIQDL